MLCIVSSIFFFFHVKFLFFEAKAFVKMAKKEMSFIIYVILAYKEVNFIIAILEQYKEFQDILKKK